MPGPTIRMAVDHATLYASTVVTLSLHTADPGETGASEVAGGTYVRLPVTWTINPATGAATSSTVLFNVPDNTNVRYIGMWNDAGEFVDSAAFNADFPVASTVEVNLYWYINGVYA